jgi:hypothetical protein
LSGTARKREPTNERRNHMVTTQQYRAKAAEYAGLAKSARSASERREFRALERTSLAEAANQEWLAGYDARTMPASHEVDDVCIEEEQILRCLGAAVIMRWATLPNKIQRELFEDAGAVGELHQASELRRQIARFLHNHKDDA